MTTFAVNLLASDQRETAFPLYILFHLRPLTTAIQTIRHTVEEAWLTKH